MTAARRARRALTLPARWLPTASLAVARSQVRTIAYDAPATGMSSRSPSTLLVVQTYGFSSNSAGPSGLNDVPNEIHSPIANHIGVAPDDVASIDVEHSRAIRANPVRQSIAC